MPASMHKCVAYKHIKSFECCDEKAGKNAVGVFFFRLPTTNSFIITMKWYFEAHELINYHPLSN